jgi:hypothetical protein
MRRLVNLRPAPLKRAAGAEDAGASTSTVVIDLGRTAMKSRAPVAKIRLGWPLGMLHGLSGTCCPTTAIHKKPGVGACFNAGKLPAVLV